MHRADIRRPVLRWSASLDRPLPWRGERDPWRVLCSEVMLQQTQAGRVAEIYPRFLARFPTVEAMAQAPAADVLRAWSNLGYPRRALNLWRAARAVTDRGGFPRSVAELETLPGVGPYTARAVASFAFGEKVGAVDANVKRVIRRVYGEACEVQPTADALAARGDPRVWNQAMIDLGAVVCTARKPRCGSCPLRERCVSADTPLAGATKARPSPPFERTARYARGRVMAQLRLGAASLATLRSSTSLEDARLRDAIASLERDGLVHRRGRLIALGPAASARR